MSTNPYASPEFSGAAPPTPPHIAVRGPAIGLLLVQSIWLVILLGGIIKQLVQLFPDVLNSFDRDWAVATGQMLGILVVIAWLGLLVFTVYGAYCMFRLQKLRMARMAAIIALIPICSGCYVFGIPFGIWALVVLNRPEVKAAFR